MVKYIYNKLNISERVALPFMSHNNFCELILDDVEKLTDEKPKVNHLSISY